MSRKICVTFISGDLDTSNVLRFRYQFPTCNCIDIMLYKCNLLSISFCELMMARVFKR